MRNKIIAEENIFPRWEQNIPTLGTKHSHAGNKTGLRLTCDDTTARASRHFSDLKGIECGVAIGSCPTRLRLVVMMLLMLCCGGIEVRADNFEGIWYIANDNSSSGHPGKVYSSAALGEKYYLVPAADPQQLPSCIDAYYSPNHATENGDPEKPFLTTKLTSQDLNSIWIVKESEESGYYFIIHALTGKYVIYEPPLPNADNKRKSMHLQTPDNGDYNLNTNDKFKFKITTNGTGYNICPKSRSGWYMNPAGQNSDYYYGQVSGETPDLYRNGLVGVYNNAGTNSIWHFEDASSATTPIISDVDGSTNTFTITSPVAAFSSIRYTTDGTTTPNASTGNTVISGSPVTITSTMNVQAVGVFSTTVVTPVAGPKELSPIAPPPTISYNYTTTQVTISSATALSYYYTIDGSTPTTDSTPYNDPFTVTTPTTVKAIAIYPGNVVSEVAELVISQVGTPTIQNNGSNAISITSATPGATIYYTTDGTDPTISSTLYEGPLTENVSNVTIKAIAVKENMITSEVGSGSVKLKCATPVITRTGLSFTLSCSMPTDATFYYSLNGSIPATLYDRPVTLTSDQLPVTVTAVAKHDDYDDSDPVSFLFKKGTGTTDDPYLIYGTSDFTNFVTNVNSGTTASACYKLGADVSASGIDAITTEFTGIFDGDGYTISNLGHALFNSVNGGTVKNVILDAVSISGGTNAGAIANKIAGTSSKMASIYNCGVLSGSISGSGYVGSIVGWLGDSDNDNCYARVINCYSYATVAGGSDVGGIVGYNSVASTQASLTTMVMNCMFYGDITDGGTISPIYGGVEINNVEGGMNNYNYYRYRSPYSVEKRINKYNRALPMEEKFITRFERYRLLLNSNKKLAAIYATGSADNADQMAKWILETADRQIANPMPYPVLRKREYNKKYPSIINYDAKHAPDSTTVGRNHGGKLGKTLSITISNTKTDGGQSWPTGASITNGSLTLQRTDKDYDRYNFNYDKVQLPYYNDVGTGNYTKNRVVTGWKITSITGGTTGTYTAADEWGGYNFADRHCTNKDKYSVSGRVFSQGAYWDVPEGVTAITIEPYWAIANYVSDATYDVVYDKDYAIKTFTTAAPFGIQYSNNTNIDIYGDGNNQKVYTSISNALSGFNASDDKTVYDQAVVLVGNVHQYANPTNNDIPYTVMSIDMNHDNEPDYSYIFSHNKRQPISPIRYDFLNIMGLAEAQIPNDATLLCNVSIFNLKGWFEITNTCVVNFSQFEYENTNSSQNYVAKSPAPLILLGGTYEQFVSTQKASRSGFTKYIHVGSNAWFAKFGNGTHSDGKGFTTHIPISVTGGDYDEFYLSGTYQPNITNMESDNAECYISGGRFGEVAGASLEAIQGDVRWDINWADITNFYGGGVNAVNPITGDIRIDMTNSYVDRYCGGPKFGDMTTGKSVTTNATDCLFGTYYGAGFGGNAYNRVKYRDESGKEPANHQSLYQSERGKYYDGSSTYANDSHKDYGKKGKGVATDFDSEFFIWSTGETGARFFVQFVTFSLATTHGVTSILTKCKVTGNVYGGGSLGKVDGDVSTTLNNCDISGNVFGAGFSATLPTVDVRKTPAFITGKEPKKNMNIGLFEPGEINTTDKYEWKQVASSDLKNGESGVITEDGKNYVYTDTDLSALGTVTGEVTLNIQGTTTVAGSVYGGGEESGVDGDTEVNVTGGTIGTQGNGGVEYGNVYGGGKGKRDNVTAGLVKGNTKVTIQNTKVDANTTIVPTIYHNVYGGGAYGSVGDFEYDATTGMPTGLKTTAPENSGKTEVYIKGGTFGWNGKENGMVFGSSRGDVGSPGSIEDKMAWVYDTHVAIGDTATNATITTATPLIKGSIYGGGENGHNLNNAYVRINGGTIGIKDNPTTIVTYKDDPTDATKVTYEGYDFNYPYRGNVYGGGCGTDTYIDTNDGNKEKCNSLAGVVKGNAFVNITGGYIVHNVYGAGAMGSVGTDVAGARTKVNISGGRVGYDGSRNGNVFGAARGEYGESTATSGLANVSKTEVNISYATTPAADNDGKTEQLIAGSVFGGGESGTVKESVTLKMTGGLILKDVYGGGALADTQTSNWNGTTWAEGKSSSSSTTTVRLTGGTILGEAYGGGLGESASTDAPNGKPAYVYGDVLLDLNGTTSSGEEGTAIANDARGCAVHEVFGCNNANGTPMGKVLVHVYATQNKDKSQIANTNGETPVTDAKTEGSYDVFAVYGGGNLAAYEPAGGKNTTYSTNVIIDGCKLTSIKQVYGGGNAASTPATSVTINGTYEIEEVFGGGNGKDAITVNNVTKPNPGANVGYKDYSVYYQEDDVWKVKDDPNYDTKNERINSDIQYGTGKASVNIFGGTVHRVFGGSNTKGNVRQTAVTLLDEASDCDFCVDEAYGGGKEAPMDAEAKLLMACIPGLAAAYGGAEAADIQGNVILNITNGTFDRVFGGNNKSGTISGSIMVNVSEVGCKPIIIGELYGGGNLAGYSVYGYNNDKSLKETGTQLYSDPQVNVKSFTSIGTVYGGGYGTGAVMVGSPTVNISEVVGSPKTYPTTGDFEITGEGANQIKRYKGKEITIDEGTENEHTVTLPAHEKGKIGVINNVFGGGNAAIVKGDTYVNIGASEVVYEVAKPAPTPTNFADGTYYVLSGEGTPDNPYEYVSAGSTFDADKTYYEKKDVLGVDIRGDVYGGGNNADVTGDTHVTIGKETTTTSTNPTPTP